MFLGPLRKGHRAMSLTMELSSPLLAMPLKDQAGRELVGRRSKPNVPGALEASLGMWEVGHGGKPATHLLILHQVGPDARERNGGVEWGYLTWIFLGPCRSPLECG